MNQRLAKILFKNETLNSNYLSRYLSSPHILHQLKLAGEGSVQINVSTEDILNLQIPLPPLSTQKDIVEYLDIETAKIDTLIDTIAQEIELTREYKQSLIYKAVTGKISVG